MGTRRRPKLKFSNGSRSNGTSQLSPSKILPRSPDLSPIENIFKLFSDTLRKQAMTSRMTTETYEQFKDRVISTIESIPIEIIKLALMKLLKGKDRIN